MRTTTIRTIAFRTIAISSFALALMLALPAAAQSSGTNDEAGVATSQRVDVNSAGLEELTSLPGIGPALAQRIIDEREIRPFRRPQELVRVKGIGETTMQRLMPFVRARAPAKD